MKQEITVNGLLVLMNGIRGRLSGLKELRKQTANKEVFYGSSNKETTPMYDVKTVDKQIVMLENFLMEADSKIKESNALTKVELEFDKEKLFASLE